MPYSNNGTDTEQMYRNVVPVPFNITPVSAERDVESLPAVGAPAGAAGASVNWAGGGQNHLPLLLLLRVELWVEMMTQLLTPVYPTCI
jgi:hypothetical protein